jgi:uncharacterized protein (TIGR02001 family)
VRAGVAVRTKAVHRIPAQGPKTHGLGAFLGHLRGFQGGTAFAKQFHVQTHLEPYKMKKTLLAVTLAALTSGAATSALAAEPKAPAPDFEISGNFGLFSDYRFRGVSQTARQPALQGGVDLGHKSGFYAGNWNSNVSGLSYTDGSMESDVYFGYRFEVSGVGLDIGNLYYYYPGTTGDFNTNEIYIGASYGQASLKVSYTTTNWFGTADSSGSLYYDLTFTNPLSEKLTGSIHAGWTKVANTPASDYKDFKLGLSYDLGNNLALSAAYFFNTGAGVDGGAPVINGKKTGGDGAVISLSKTF